MKKINIIGTSGSGKTTFSVILAQKLNYPLIEMDKIFWGPNWHWPKDEIFFKKLENSISGESWVLDGNYTRTIPIKWAACDTVIWLDYSFLRTLFQAFKRAIYRSFTQVEIWEGTGNKESFRKSFLSKESILLWTLKTHGKVRKKYLSYMIDPKFSHIQFIRLRSPKEANLFLNKLN